MMIDYMKRHERYVKEMLEKNLNRDEYINFALDETDSTANGTRMAPSQTSGRPAALAVIA